MQLCLKIKKVIF
jgi:hypothetical protein